MIGQTVSHYKVLSKIGAGGMGEVYLARDTKLERDVALKFLPRHYSSDPEFNARFHREAKAAAALNHSNIITIHEISEHDGRAFISMEYVEGQTLRELISQKTLSASQTIEIASQIAAGIQAAHAANIVHRDLKPENIVVQDGGRVKILDFGLAKLDSKTKLTTEASTLGTVNYMSPEQCLGEEVDHRTDIWATGVILYEMVSGRLPFESEFPNAVMYNIVHEEPAILSSHVKDAPIGLQRVVETALTKDRESRYQRIDDLVNDLQGDQRSSTTHPATFNLKINRIVKVLGGALVVGALVGIGYLAWQFSRPAQVVEPGSSRSAVAVLPFSVQAGESLAYLQDGMVTLLSTNLDQAGVVRSIDPNAVLGAMAKNSQAIRDPYEGQQFASQFGSDYFILGDVISVGDNIQLNGSLYDAAGTLRGQAKQNTENENGLLACIDALTLDLLASFPAGSGQQLLNIAGQTTSSLPALKA